MHHMGIRGKVVLPRAAGACGSVASVVDGAVGATRGSGAGPGARVRGAVCVESAEVRV